MDADRFSRIFEVTYDMTRVNRPTGPQSPVSNELAGPFGLGPGARKALYWAGTILFLLSLVYVGAFVARNWHNVRALPHLSPIPLALAATLYGITHVSSSTAWLLLLRNIGECIDFRTGLRINFIAQIGKYLPGNVAHYFARAGLASRTGVKLGRSGIATFLEILATISTGALVSCVAMLFDDAPIKIVFNELANTSALTLGLILAGAAGTAIFVRVCEVPFRAMLGTAACLVTSFVFAGLSFFAVVLAVSATGSAISPFAAIGIFAIAWTAGYVVPGAPAGLGVREAILVIWLSPVVGAAPAIACVIVHRVVTAGVDAVIALTGYTWIHLASPKP